MTTVYQRGPGTDGAQTPATHVLIVGVGDYPHLKKTKFAGIKPLGSPPRSAKAMADWFIRGAGTPPGADGFHNPAAPLASVELLISPATTYDAPTGESHSVAVPAYDAIEKAFETWLARLGKTADNRGVFHFCGHGLVDGRDQVVLADDFGRNGDRKIWRESFNVTRSVLGAIRETPATLFFFIDACMEFSKDLAFQEGVTPQALVDLDGSKPPLTTEWVILRAATEGRLAFAKTDGLSRFTAALLKGLSGFCGRPKPGSQLYEVTWPQLRDATAYFLERESRGSVHKQTISEMADGRGAAPLHVLRRKPNVLVELDVSPNGYRAAARVYVQGSQTFGRVDAALADGPAEFVVPMSTYVMGAESVGGAFAHQSLDDQLALPPSYDHAFDIK